jgi:hypothetical protein
MAKSTVVDEALGIVRGGGSRGPKLREKSPLDMLADPKLANEIRELQRLGPKMSDEFYNAERARILKAMQTNTFVVDSRFINAKGEPSAFNLAPNASIRTYLMPDGSIVRRNANQPAPRGSQPLNKSVEELETLLPPSRGVPAAPAAPAAPAMSADDAALAAAREANEAARAARSAESADEAAKAAATESRASTMGPPAPPPRPAPAPDMTAASPAEQAFRAGQPTREAVQSNTPRNVAVGVGLGALGAGAARQAYEDMPYKSSGADVGEFSRMDYVPPRPAETDVSQFSRADFMPGSPTDVSEFSRMDYVEPTTASTGRLPDILAPIRGDTIPEGAVKRAIEEAKRRSTPATPTQIATAAADNPTGGGFFGRVANAIYDPNYLSDKSPRDLYAMAQQMQERGDEYGSHLMTGRAMSMDRSTGGKAGSGAVPKDAALHKALEIIHMMLSRR